MGEEDEGPGCEKGVQAQVRASGQRKRCDYECTEEGEGAACEVQVSVEEEVA